MNLLASLLGSEGAPALQQLASGFGIGESDAKKALTAIVPSLTQGVQRNISSSEGLDSLMNALSKGNHQRYLEQPELLDQADTIADGNGILGHLLGSKDASRQLASQAASQTGLDSSLLKKMLPVLASMVMGGLSKQAATQNFMEGSRDAGGLLSQFLDANKDGSIVDDLLSMAGKFMK